MGYKVLWTDSAKADVENIVNHIANVLDSPKAASEHLDAFLKAAQLISGFPEAHAISAHPSLACRELCTYCVKNYIMPYSSDGAVAIAHRVFHGRQDYARLI